ncbi:hypothetical protein [Paractinoplanes toevensis]|uniref:DUF4351 domain-containing protein n=1 Tax=Paractinoplanes toevensis TaxID=571911 RepID=A0A920BNW8_9ACTN|nr:hypothetical protein [Actinoplanes toevensis]GIM96267.1 hypothetical protein Ato02nite_080600 [Actinoplanes toevensis]
MPVDATPGSKASRKDYDGLFKSMFEAHPEDTLRILFGAELDGRQVVLEGPTEQQRRLTRSRDKVYLALRDREEQDRAEKDGLPIPLHDVYHLEVQVERVTDFEERMMSYWSSLALKYSRARHRLHQVVVWPFGGGYPGNFQRDGAALRYTSWNLAEDLDPEYILASGLAPLALWSKNPPPDAVERVAETIAATADPDERLVLVELGKLGPRPIATQLVKALMRRGMSDILEGTEFARDLARRKIEEGRAEGRDEGRVEALAALLKHHYGAIDDLPELARKLAAVDYEQHLQWVTDRVPLEQLRAV